MPKHKLLYDYLTERAEDISQTWFDTLHETDPDSVYASTDPAVLTNLKKQNLAFNYQLNRIFSEEKEVYTAALEKWAFKAARDKEHLKTPIHYIIREFIRVRDLYVGHVKQFTRLHTDTVTEEDAEDIFHTLIKSFDVVIHIFIEEIFLLIKQGFKKRLSLAIPTFFDVRKLVLLCKIEYNKLNIWGGLGELLGDIKRTDAPHSSRLFTNNERHERKKSPVRGFFYVPTGRSANFRVPTGRSVILTSDDS
ncbi:Stressosome protein rsbRC [Mycobacteroides abscessus subsp. massiliense]|nr:Stressosome protein rsbRC [Mycobacteroides abscessus subsp. massiliense]